MVFVTLYQGLDQAQPSLSSALAWLGPTMVGTNALVSTFVLREVVSPYFGAFKDNLIQMCGVWSPLKARVLGKLMVFLLFLGKPFVVLGE